MGIPQYPKLIPKPRIRLYRWPFDSSTLPKGMRWQCYGSPMLLCFDTVDGLGDTPQKAYDAFIRNAERAQGQPTRHRTYLAPQTYKGQR